MCSNLTDKHQDQIHNSDNISSMAARTFDDIITFVRKSNLNFQLQMSPYSAYISLKKSPMKDKSGCYLQPSSQCLKHDDCANLIKRNSSLEEEISKLKVSYDKALKDVEVLTKKVENLEGKKNIIKSEKEHVTSDLFNQIECKSKIIQELSLKVTTLQSNNDSLSSSIVDLKKQILDASSTLSVCKTSHVEEIEAIKKNKLLTSKFLTGNWMVKTS